MVAKRKPSTAEVIDRLARQSDDIQAVVPFFRIPDHVTDLESLMAFDRDVCRMHRQFTRPLHPADMLDARLAKQTGVTIAGGTVLVTQVGPGIRSRIITEGPKTAANAL